MNKLEESKENLEDIQKNKLCILKIVNQNKDDIFKSLDKDNESFILEQIKYIKKIHSELHLNKVNLNVSSQDLDEIDSNLELTIKSYLYETIKNKDNYYYRNHSKNYVETFRVMVEEFNSYKSLDKEIFTFSFLKPKINKKGLNSGQLYDFPVPFELAITATTTGILSFIFRKEHLNELLNQTHNKKNILEYILDSKPTQILPILNVIKEDPELFNTLILKNKKILRQLKTIDNEEIETIIKMMELNKNLIKNIPQEQHYKKIKI